MLQILVILCWGFLLLAPPLKKKTDSNMLLPEQLEFPKLNYLYSFLAAIKAICWRIESLVSWRPSFPLLFVFPAVVLAPTLEPPST